ncbi:MAG: hypothetical protein ACHQ2Y_10265 [Candidatus Lutacidiplasmatales archaeon]
MTNLRLSLAIAALVAVLFVPAMSSPLAPGSPGSIAAHVETPIATSHSTATPVASQSPLTHVAQARSVAPAAKVSPNDAPRCPTPSGGSIAWTSSSFFNDVAVSFFVPGHPELSGSNFQTGPCVNVVPTYLNGFWMNISTNVRIAAATVSIWGVGWPTAANAEPPLSGFDPTRVSQPQMYLVPPLYHQAVFFFNVYRFFWPGSHIYFNVSVQTTNATPSTIYSSRSIPDPFKYNGITDNATWEFETKSPWASTNFSNDIAISTTPDVLGTPAYFPNPEQKLQVTLTSLNLSGGPAGTIPMALLTLVLSGNITGVFSSPFSPANHTVMNLTHQIPAYLDTKITFNVTAWLPWEGGQVDKIQSPYYSFNFTKNGGWWNPDQALEDEKGVVLSATPNVLTNGTVSEWPTGTAVNVTVHSGVQNVTIGSCEIHFRFWDQNGETTGVLPMVASDQNTSWAVIPGLPPNSNLTFSIIAKDINGVPLSSGNNSYREAGKLGTAPPPGYGLVFFEAVDLTTGLLVPSLNYTLSNATWSETRMTSPVGFGAPEPLSGLGYLPVAYGPYVLTIRAFGQSQVASFTVGTATPSVIVFYVASGAVNQAIWVPGGSLTLPAGIGLVGGFLAAIPLSSWFKERRKKAEAEQRRITL